MDLHKVLVAIHIIFLYFATIDIDTMSDFKFAEKIAKYENYI